MFYNSKLCIILVPDYPTSKPFVKTKEECYYKALYYIGRSLNCLPYVKKDKNIMVCIKLLTYKKISNLS